MNQPPIQTAFTTPNSTVAKVAVIIGATGLVGSYLLPLLTQYYQHVIVLARRQPKHIHANLHFYQVKDFTHLANSIANISTSLMAADVFSCLGTTQKEAGSKVNFKTVDHDFNVAFAQACQQAGAKRLFLLSSAGANAHAHSFYLKVKGELENSVAKLSYQQVYVFQPSLLLGEHLGRTLESLGQKLFRLVKPIVPKYANIRPIEAARVAQAMFITADHAANIQQKIQGQLRIINNTAMLKATDSKIKVTI